MNLAHINFGEPGGKQPVDSWHMDSVDYVLVLILSDLSGAEGGELMVAQTSDTDWALTQIQKDDLPKDLIDVVNYKAPGYAIFMQGSRIAHTVSPVKAAKETRISVVNSYQTLDPFQPDSTVYRTFKAWDGDDIAAVEFARHKAWRAQGQLDYLIKHPTWGNPETSLKLLEKVMAELKGAHDMISGKSEDKSPYLVKPQSRL